MKNVQITLERTSADRIAKTNTNVQPSVPKEGFAAQK